MRRSDIKIWCGCSTALRRASHITQVHRVWCGLRRSKLLALETLCWHQRMDLRLKPGYSSCPCRSNSQIIRSLMKRILQEIVCKPSLQSPRIWLPRQEISKSSPTWNLKLIVSSKKTQGFNVTWMHWEPSIQTSSNWSSIWRTIKPRTSSVMSSTYSGWNHT